MPRYLVTLRHAETGETRTVLVSSANSEEAMFDAVEAHDDMFPQGDSDWMNWHADHACPADDEPVPFRDR